MAPQTSNSSRRSRGGLALVGTIGGYVLSCLLAGLLLGLGLDHVLSSGPLFLIMGVVVGFALSFFLIYKLAMAELVE